LRSRESLSGGSSKKARDLWQLGVLMNAVLPKGSTTVRERPVRKERNEEREMKKFAGKRAAVLAAGLSVMLVAGVAFAAWTANGSGSGNAKALTASTVIVNASTGTADLYPGSTGAVYFTLTNNNPYAITFNKLTAASVTAVNGGPTSGTCNATDLTVTATLPLTVSLPVAASTTSAQESIGSLVTLNHAATDDCQGAVWTVSLTLTGSQN